MKVDISAVEHALVYQLNLRVLLRSNPLPKVKVLRMEMKLRRKLFWKRDFSSNGNIFSLCASIEILFFQYSYTSFNWCVEMHKHLPTFFIYRVKNERLPKNQYKKPLDQKTVQNFVRVNKRFVEFIFYKSTLFGVQLAFVIHEFIFQKSYFEFHNSNMNKLKCRWKWRAGKMFQGCFLSKL